MVHERWKNLLLRIIFHRRQIKAFVSFKWVGGGGLLSGPQWTIIINRIHWKSTQSVTQQNKTVDQRFLCFFLGKVKLLFLYFLSYMFSFFHQQILISQYQRVKFVIYNSMKKFFIAFFCAFLYDLRFFSFFFSSCYREEEKTEDKEGSWEEREGREERQREMRFRGWK